MALTSGAIAAGSEAVPVLEVYSLPSAARKRSKPTPSAEPRWRRSRRESHEQAVGRDRADGEPVACGPAAVDRHRALAGCVCAHELRGVSAAAPVALEPA